MNMLCRKNGCTQANRSRMLAHYNGKSRMRRVKQLLSVNAVVRLVSVEHAGKGGSTCEHCHLNLVKSVFVSSVEHLAMPFNEENAFSDVHPFLLSKWKSIFITFFDSNNSKEIDWSDFYLITKRVGDLYGVDSEQMRLTRKRMQPLWDGLVELADLNKDEKIQLSEWVDFLKRCENGQNAEMRWIQEYMNFVFQLFDVSCDGKIDFPEYVDGMKTYGVAESTARRAFSLITDACDHDHAKAFFDKATFNNLWKQYFFSKDKLATGNHLFGMVE
ncbi:Calexcitin-1 [Trichinella pseudospiralis]